MEHYINAWKNFANFNGRARRQEYWQFIVFNIFINWILGLFLGAVLGANAIGSLLLLSAIFPIAIFIPSLSVAVRRMHDVGKSGWFMLIPIYNIILAFTAGTAGPNQYGPDPKATAPTAA